MKSLLDFLRSVLFTKPAQKRGKIPIYVRCDRCGEVLTTAVNLQHDLSVEYGDNPREDTYIARKTLIGSNLCFQRVDVELHFDAQKRVVADEVTGGTLITEGELEGPTTQPG
ncbi:MAG: hypothetical protein P1P76_10285 [Anaerolineales bacterium]|nr:hypothetical protein [Anaerolineales bacterium]